MGQVTKKMLEQQKLEADQYIAELEQRLAEKEQQKEIDISKGSGYIDIMAWASSISLAKVRYPIIAFTAMGIVDKAKIVEAVKEIDTESKQIHIGINAQNRNLTNDAKGVSNRPAIITRLGKFIGNRATLILPKAINRGGTRGKPQNYVLVRMSNNVPLAGLALIQYWLNTKATDDASKITRFFGPSKKIIYRVPTEIDAAKKTLAAGEAVAPTGTAEQGQGQP